MDDHTRKLFNVCCCWTLLLLLPQELLSSMSGWKVVLQRRLPLCRLVLWRELAEEPPWGDVPDEDG
jgi:hypothetical protein